MNDTWVFRVEPIIYAEVNLRYESSGRAFLRTIRNSKTKTHSFFAQHVRSLVIRSDVGSQLVMEILSVCRGIINFSYWATTCPSARQSPITKFKHTSGQVAPQRMSVLLHENHIYPLKPHFNLAFFSSVTHLSILNSCEEWTTWTHISSDAMPALTHIKFDMNVQRSRPSRPCNMNIWNFRNSGLDSAKNDSWDQPQILMTWESPRWLDNTLCRVANTLTEVLNNSHTLRVCILVLRFDANPDHTVKFITYLASQKLLGARLLLKTDVPAADWFDPRLVFAHEREPFRYSHAHSKHEMNLWKSAEAKVNSQRHITGMLFFYALNLHL